MAALVPPFFLRDRIVCRNQDTAIVAPPTLRVIGLPGSEHRIICSAERSFDLAKERAIVYAGDFANRPGYDLVSQRR